MSPRAQVSPFAFTALMMFATGISGCGPSESDSTLARARRTATAFEPLVLLITADTLRADHLGVYGYSKQTSPNIDRFAEEAVVFENCFAHSSATRTSFASLLTGFLPHENGSQPNQPLPLAVDSIAELLRRKGFRTIAVIGNYVLRGERGWSQGFDIYDDEMDAVEAVRKLPERRAESIAKRAIELIDAHRDEALFLWIHFQDPHGPYTPPEDFGALFDWTSGESTRLKFNENVSGRNGLPSYQRLGEIREFDFYQAAYDGEIRYMDSYFGRVIDQLRIQGRIENSLIIFTSDHGEAMGERDLYFVHGEYLYENLTRVPLLLKRGAAPGGRRIEPCQHLDVVPTILSFVGDEADPRFRGRNLADPVLRDTPIVAFARSAVDGTGAKYSIRRGELKLIYNPSTERTELFHVGNDPRETTDLAGIPDFQEALQDLMRALSRTLKDDRLHLDIAPAPPIRERELEGLRALGYIE